MVEAVLPPQNWYVKSVKSGVLYDLTEQVALP
jgi:hypothetical protein